MAILYLLAGLLFVHMSIGSAIMLHFMRQPGFKPWWWPMTLSEFFALWVVFAFGWSLAATTKTSPQTGGSHGR